MMSSFVLAWSGSISIASAIVVAIATNSVRLTILAAVGWLLLAQCLYSLQLIYLTLVERRRRAKFILRTNKNALSVTALQSRVIKSVAHDDTLEMLMVEFHDGRIRYFRPVNRAVYLNLIAAPSPGTYYKRHIRSLRQNG
jgi:hypothetical protein